MKFKWGIWPVIDNESTLDLLKRKSVEAGIDPSYWDEIANVPSEPGSLGPGDPGKLSVEKTVW